MKLFVIFNILILLIIGIRFLADGKISRKTQYAIWLIIPFFLLVYSFVQIPFKVYVHNEFLYPINEIEYESNFDFEDDGERWTTNQLSTGKNDEVNNGVVSVSEGEDTAQSASDYLALDAGVDLLCVLRIVQITGSIVTASYILIKNALFAIELNKTRRYYSVSEYGNLNVYKLSGITSPFLFGRSIYVPDSMERDTPMYKHAICHEYCHFHMGDGLWLLLKYVFLISLWFDPLVWISLVLIEQDSELAVDEKVIDILGEDNKIDYGTTLVSFVSKVSRMGDMTVASISLSGSGNSFMKNRIEHIVNRSERNLIVTVTIIALLSSVVTAFLCKPYKIKAATVFDENTPWYSAERINITKTSQVTSLLPLFNTNNCFWIRGIDSLGYTKNLYCCDCNGNLLSSVNVEKLSINAGFSYDGNSYFVGAKDFIGNGENYIYKVSENGKQLELVSVINGIIGNINGVSSLDNYLVICSSYKSKDKIYTYDLLSGQLNEIGLDIGDDHNFDAITLIDRKYGASRGEQIFLKLMKSNESCVCELNPATGEIKRINPNLESLIKSNLDPLFLDDQYIICQNGNQIFKYDYLNSKPVELVADLSYSDISSRSNDVGIVAYLDGNLILQNYDSQSDYNLFYVIKQSDNNHNTGKKILTVAMISSYNKNALSSFIDEYNNADNDYYLYVTSRYSLSVESNNYLIEDIKNGRGPDIIIGAESSPIVGSDALYTDLSGYMRELNKDDYSNLVFEGYKLNNCTYCIPYAMGINGILIYNGDEKGFTLDQYVDFINYKHGGKDIQGFNCIGQKNKKQAFKEMFCNQSIYFLEDNSFDILSGKDSKLFDRLVDYIDNERTSFQDLSGDEITVASEVYFHNFNDYLIDTNGMPKWISGLPSFDGSGAINTEDYTVSITNCCSDKEAAWGIIKELLGYDFQTSLGDSSIPVYMPAAEEQCNKVIKDIYSCDDDSSTAIVALGQLLSESDLESAKNEYLNIVKSINNSRYEDVEITNIVTDELDKYFDEKITFDVAKSNIQIRVNKLLEKRK